jgi:hypothetical protein
MSLDDLLRRMGADSPQPDHASPGRPPRPDHSDAHRPVLPGPAAMPGDECDATIVPIVTGRVDHDLLGKLTAQLTSASPGHTGLNMTAAAPQARQIRTRSGT